MSVNFATTKQNKRESAVCLSRTVVTDPRTTSTGSRPVLCNAVTSSIGYSRSRGLGVSGVTSQERPVTSLARAPRHERLQGR